MYFRTEKVIETLKMEEAFDEGSPASESIKIKEGQLIKMRLRGNVKLEDNTEELSFVYNSNKVTSLTRVGSISRISFV